MKIAAAMLILVLGLPPRATCAAVNGVFVNEYPGGVEYLSLTTTGPDVAGYLQTFGYAPGVPGGVSRTRRELVGSAQGSHLILRVAPTWLGLGSLTGEVGWGIVTIQFAKPDGTLGQARFRQMSLDDANAAIARFAAASAAGAQQQVEIQRRADAAAQRSAAFASRERLIAEVNADLVDSQSQLHRAYIDLAKQNAVVKLAEQQASSAKRPAHQAISAENAAQAHEAQERAIEEQMRAQESVMPSSTQDERDARSSFHEQVLAQHDKVNDAHASVNDAHSIVNDSGSMSRDALNALANARRDQAQMERRVALLSRRIRNDREALVAAH